MDLAAVEQIARVKFRYARALDTKSWSELADTLIPEATAVYGEHLSFESRDVFVNFLENTLGVHMITEHHCSHPEIDLSDDGRTATGTWLLADTVIVPEDGMVLRGSAHYHDRYVLCEDDRWRIAHTGYERNWETVVSMSDVPSFRVSSGRWALLQQPPRAS
ncbi:MAG: nuclear transport factor 2 family protein [Rhodococcus sp.]|uniref:nuclear transport factor 2 family protein n=1 Tax=Rhodococcus TaxID=1827 RepID=UPI00169A13E1|nr:MULTISPECIES: nuclear transport factor 2 family protein [Rhodococcus]NLV78637.1 nuclear transport factor 2 family protein [Rhodococcus sp. (in: high G+C Gram-positive bacteria)]